MRLGLFLATIPIFLNSEIVSENFQYNTNSLNNIYYSREVEKKDIIEAFIEDSDNIYLNDINDLDIVKDTWNYDEIKNLNININLEESISQNRYIELYLPEGIKLSNNYMDLIDDKFIIDIDDSKFAQTGYSASNKDFTYYPTSGKLRFKVSNSAKFLSINLLIKVDDTLWNSVDNVLAHDKNNKAVRVRFIEDNTIIEEKKIDEIYVDGKNWDYFSTLHPSPPNILIDNESFTMRVLFNPRQNHPERFYKYISTSIEIPNYKYTINGVEKVVYATLEEAIAENGGRYTIEQNRVVFEWNNYYGNSLYGSATFRFEEPPYNNEQTVVSKYGDIFVENFFTGDIIKLKDRLTDSRKIIASNIEKFDFIGYSKGVYSGDYINRDKINTFIGAYVLKNYGAKTDCKYIKIEFPDIENTSFGVTRTVLPLIESITDYSINVNIQNITTKEIRKDTITLNNNKNNNYILKAKDISKESNNDWYLKSVEYKLGEMPKTWSYYTGWLWGGSSIGSIQGKYIGGQVVSNIKVSIGNQNDFISNSEKSIYIKTTPQTEGYVTAGVTSFGFYDSTNNTKISSIVAGDDFKIKGDINTSDYTYMNSTYLPEPVILIRIPKNISINFENSNFYYNNVVKLNHSIQLIKETDDNFNLYEISFNDDKYGIGYYSESFDKEGYITFDIALSTSKNMRTTIINSRETIFLKDKKMILKNNSGGASWAGYNVEDKFDLDGDGDITEYNITTSIKNELGISSSTSWLDIDNSSEDKNGVEQKYKQEITDINDEISYKLIMNNNNDGYVRSGGIEYYIPIPKKNLVYNNYITNESFNFDMVLTKEVEDIIGYDILYSYNNQEYFKYSNNLDLNKVSMIKISNIKDINPGDTFSLGIMMRYLDNSWNNTNNINTWSAYGIQTYEKNNSEFTFLHMLDEFKVELIFNPKILDNPENKSVKVGDKAIFSTNIDVGIPIAVGNWQYKPLNSLEWIDLSETSTTLTIENADYSMNGNQYRYKATNKGATVGSLPATLTVTDNESPSITLNEFKDGDIYKITITAIDNESGISHIILPDGTRINSNTYTMIADVNKEYTFKVYDLAGNESIKSTMIGVMVPQNVTSNLDLYIKSENMLQMSLDTNIITFEDFNGTEDIVKENAINININSSLPYQINAYLPTEIQNSDKLATMDKRILNIKENSETEYKSFTNINEKLVLKDNCIAGNGLIHGIDIKLKGSIAHEKNIYKTTIKFEVMQK